MHSKPIDADDADAEIRQNRSSVQAPLTQQSIRALASGGIGNILEWYDFTVYAYLAAILAAKFFATGDPATALLSTFALFGVGFVARPFGGILIALFGDKFGRKPALMLTFGMIAGSTTLIGLLPTYPTIGVAAPLLLLLARLLQGASAGGEWGGAASFLVEWAPRHRRGLFGSLHPCAVCIGLLLGSGVTGLLTMTLGQETMQDWGWRIPFLLGAVVGPLGLYVRRNVHETPAFVKSKMQREHQTLPPRASASEIARELITAFAFPTVQSVIVYLILGYFPTFAQKYVGLTASQSLWSTALATVMMGGFCVLSGWASDKIGRKPSLYGASLLFALLSYPAIALLVTHPGLVIVVIIQSAMAGLCGIFLGGMSAALVEHFPTSRRLTGMTIAYNLQSVIFGGFAPFIASWLIVKTGAPVSIAYFIIFAAVVSLFGVSRMRETARQALR